MEKLLSQLSEKKDEFKGNPKDLDKLIQKIESFWHAPTTDKHTKRMLPFAEVPELIEFTNEKLKEHFINCNAFQDDEHGLKTYDIIASWYLFALLAYSPKVEDTIVFMLDRMKASQNPDLSLMRRVLHLCNNAVYEKQLKEIEDYFQAQNEKTVIYQWLKTLGVTPPPAFNWELIIRLRAESDQEKNNFSDNLFLTVKGFEPKGNGESFEIEITDRERNISERWNDFSEDTYFRFKSQKVQLKKVPDLQHLKEFIAELEELFGLKFQQKIDFNYFSKGFKKKENIQKWLLQ